MNARLLMALRKARTDEGFTLLELLTVVVIIGILAAIALPSFLGATNRARQSEGASNVGALNRAQQAYYLENEKFAENLDELASGIPEETNNYTFSSVGVNSGVGSRAISTATLKAGSSLQGYVGLVQLSVNENGQAQSKTILCASRAGVAPQAPTNTDECGANQTRQ